MTDTLAIHSGPAACADPFPTWPHMTEAMVDAVSDVLRSGGLNYWTGPQCGDFEESYSEALGGRNVIAVANGTVALELILEGLGIGAGDEVIVPARTFLATASAVVARGGIPIVADVDPHSQNITAETIKEVASPRTKAVIVVHLAGRPCELTPIRNLVDQRGWKLIEDCAQAHGAFYRDQPIGTFSDAAAFSFCQDKIVTTGGEGGLVVTGNDRLWERMWSYKDHGKNITKVRQKSSKPVFRYIHDRFGTNFRMTSMQAAIGSVALSLLPEWIETRRRNAHRLQAALADCPGLRFESVPEHLYHSYYKCYAVCEPESLSEGWSRDEIVAALHAEGVPCGSGSCPLITGEAAFEPYPQAGVRSDYAGARWLADRSLMFLVHPTLAESDMDRMASAITKVMRAATGAPLAIRKAA